MTKKTIESVKAAVIDTERGTFYREDGTTFTIEQGDVRLAPIITQITGPLARGEIVQVSIEYPTDETNHYADFEKKSTGVVRFFKVARQKVEAFFKRVTEPVIVPEQVLGKVEEGTKVEKELAEKEAILAPADPLVPVLQTEIVEVTITSAVKADVPRETQIEKMQSAITDIMKHAQPVKDATFSKSSVDHTDTPIEDVDPAGDTIIAVVDGKAIVPNVERMQHQLKNAVETGAGTVGIEKFLARLSAVIASGKRRHSVEDLMAFVKQGDLPIADDGCILIYKLLNERGDHYVDVHSGNVKQKVGSFVVMDESLVDPSRHQDCSNGLHVAQRSYLHSFSGTVCVLAKVRPEDVIAVPAYNRNKMRVCAYHIIAKLTDHQKSRVVADKDLTDTDDGKKLLARAIAGRHIGITEEVRITQSKGGGLIITARDVVEKFDDSDEGLTPVAAIEVTSADAPEKIVAPAIDPTTLAAMVTRQQEVKAPVSGSRQDQAMSIYNRMSEATTDLERRKAAKELMEFKKAAKTGWQKLGLPDDVQVDLAKILDLPIPDKTEAQHQREAKEESKKQAKVPSKVVTGKKAAAKKAPTPKKKKAKPTGFIHRDGMTKAEKPATTLVKGPTQVEQMATLIEELLTVPTPEGRVAAAQAMFDFKRKTKKNWTTLGVRQGIVDDVIKILDK